MKKIFVCLVFLSSLTWSQDSFNFNFDYAQFGSNDTSNIIEFYYSFRQNELTKIETDSVNYVSAKLFIEMKDNSTGEYILNKVWNIKNPYFGDKAGAGSTSLMGVIGFYVPEGIYSAVVRGCDFVDTSKSREINETITVESRHGEKFTLSDIQLATNIKRENINKSSIFYKNQLEVMPNPLGVYSNTSPVLYYYCEMYNLNGTPGEKFQLNRLLYNSKGKEVYNKPKFIRADAGSIVDIGIINMLKYPTDSYTLVISLSDTSDNQGVATTKKFYMINPNVIDSSLISYRSSNFLSSEYGVYSDEDCDDLFAKSKYIATGEEIDQYKKLDSLNTKREFLFHFWNRRDSTPDTEDNEFKAEYYKRMEYVDRHYTSMVKDGYRTDRGRVYLIYGEPDQIDRFPSETNMKPYEVWYYNAIEGGVMFIFGDVTGFSNYELLHSTKRGEMQDENWQRRIQAN